MSLMPDKPRRWALFVQAATCESGLCDFSEIPLLEWLPPLRCRGIIVASLAGAVGSLFSPGFNVSPPKTSAGISLGMPFLF